MQQYNIIFRKNVKFITQNIIYNVNWLVILKSKNLSILQITGAQSQFNDQLLCFKECVSFSSHLSRNVVSSINFYFLA